MNLKSKIFLSASTALYVCSSPLMAMEDPAAKKTPPAKATAGTSAVDPRLAGEGTKNLFKAILSKGITDLPSYTPDEIGVLKFFQQEGKSIKNIYWNYGTLCEDSIDQLRQRDARRELQDWERAPLRLWDKGEDVFKAFMNKLLGEALSSIDKGSAPVGAGAGAAPKQESKGATESKKS
jgi:hypothetical protein